MFFQRSIIPTVSQIVKSISVLMAIRWVAEAWDSVQEEQSENALQSPELLGPVGSSILTSLFIFKCFFGLVSVIFLQYIANVTHRTFEIVQKNRDPTNIKIIYLYP